MKIVLLACAALVGSLLVGALTGCAEEPTPATPPSGASTEGGEPAATPSSAERPAGKVAACTGDISCNADSSISALWGRCNIETGKCSCLEGAVLDPQSERCIPTAL
ncbi:MAG TPA: hypothetical protein VLC09_20910 [Polyangiaceae bacterium]|nr:hypothetical protein [Polyangiaceae bacterium]